MALLCLLNRLQHPASLRVNPWAYLVASGQSPCPKRWEGVVNSEEERAGQWDRLVISCPENTEIPGVSLEVMDRTIIPSPVGFWKLRHQAQLHLRLVGKVGNP